LIRKVVLDNCRRLWYWKGAASLSQMAIDGVSKPKECKFPAPVNGHEVLGVIEIIPGTDVARASIEGVPATATAPAPASATAVVKIDRFSAILILSESSEKTRARGWPSPAPTGPLLAEGAQCLKAGDRELVARPPWHRQ
jgi:hypothetical protein